MQAIFSSGYANNCQLLLSKYQLVVDLAGAFGEQFARVEMPLRQYSAEMTKLGKKVQELQRDLTLRRCIIEEDSVHDLIRWFVLLMYSFLQWKIKKLMEGKS